MSNKPATPSIQKALEQSNFKQSSNNPSTWTNDDTNRIVTISGDYKKERGTGWLNWANKKSI
jgi:hypothetical protein